MATMIASVPRNALGPAYESAFDAYHSQAYNPDIAAAVNTLEIVSRRHPIHITESLRQELHDLFQAVAPALDEAEHLFNAVLAGERLAVAA